MKTKLSILLILLSLAGVAQSSKHLLMSQEYPEFTGWTPDNTFLAGLDSPYYSRVNSVTFTINRTMYLLLFESQFIGNDTKYFYRWDEASGYWVTAEQSWSFDPGYRFAYPTIFGLDGTVYGIFGGYDGDLMGNHLWQSTSHSYITTGLSSVTANSAPNHFKYKGYHYLLVGENEGNLTMYQWNSIDEQWDSFISGNIGDLGTTVRPCAFISDDKCYIIIGRKYGVGGYRFDGAITYSESTVTTGVDVSSSEYFSPNVFRYHGKLYLLVGKADGTIDGYVQTTN